MIDYSLLDLAALDTPEAYEFDEDPTYDPDLAWLDDEPEMSFAQEFDSQMDSIGWGDDSWVPDIEPDVAWDCDGNWG